MVGLDGRQRRRRLVHDEDAGLGRRAPWRWRRAAARPCGGSTRAAPRRATRRPGAAAPAPARRMRRAPARRAGDLVAEEQVGRDVEPGHEVEFLRDHGDAGRMRLARAREAHLVARRADLPSHPAPRRPTARPSRSTCLRRSRRAARAPRRPQVEVDALQRVNAAEPLLDAMKGEEGRGHERLRRPLSATDRDGPFSIRTPPPSAGHAPS